MKKPISGDRMCSEISKPLYCQGCCFFTALAAMQVKTLKMYETGPVLCLHMDPQYGQVKHTLYITAATTENPNSVSFIGTILNKASTNRILSSRNHYTSTSANPKVAENSKDMTV
jgi:hypothetical protein